MAFDSNGINQARLLPGHLEDTLIGWTYRLAGGLLVAFCVSVWLTLLTWSAADPSLTHATGMQPRNILGPLGAIVSDLALQTLGLSAMFAILPPAVWGAQLAWNERVPRFKFKLAVYPVAFLALAGALSSLPVVSSWSLNHGFGGIVGDLVLGAATGLMSGIGTHWAVVVCGMAFFAGGVAALFSAVGLTQKDLHFFWKAHLQRGSGSLLSRLHPADVAGQLRRTATGLAAGATARAWSTAPMDAGLKSAEASAAEAGYGELPVVHERAQCVVEGAGEVSASLDFGVTRDDAGIARGPAFADATERGSCSIAARFAPGGKAQVAAAQNRAAPVAAHTPAGTEAAAPRAFLRGLSTFKGTAAAYKRPSLNLLKRPTTARPGPEFTRTVLRGNARLLEDVLGDFGIKGEVKDIKPGPVVTLFELEPARGTKTSRVVALADDIARSMSVTSVRVAVVPGRNVIGIEMPNMRRETVVLREAFESDAYKSSGAVLPLALGKSISGEPVITDLSRMPHLLVAGTTGSGKSVGINAMILSLLYKKSPDECRLLMIDPKMLELSVYNDIPHLLCPVVTDPHKAINALAWAVREMEERYKRMAQLAVRNVDVFNNRVRNAQKRGEVLARRVQTGFDEGTGQAIYEQENFDLEPMPHIVIVVDEFADLMSVAGKEIEAHVQRLAQMARAAGIHLIMATQRPSVDIITGTIKANFPTRISFKVTSKIDSRTILGEQGAEQLLGQGDMLFADGTSGLQRVHGAFVADEEVEQIAAALRDQSEPRYVDGITDDMSGMATEDEAAGKTIGASDDLYDRAVAIILRDQKPSISYIQRRLSIGYNRAADLIERMEADGILSPTNSAGKRTILLGTGSSHD